MRSGLLAALGALLILAGQAWAGGARPAARPYDLLVMVVARGGGPTRVALSYPAAVDHGRLRAGIAELGRRAKAKPSQMEIRDARLAKPAPGTGTDAEFLAAGLVGKSGQLPVGPIMRSLPDWEHMRLVFVLDPSYPFSGPRDVQADGFAVRLVNQVATYEYDVERTSGKVAPAGPVELEQPLSATGMAAPARRGSGAGSAAGARGQAMLSAALIGMPSGLLVGWLLSGWRERAARARRLRRAERR